MRGPVLLLCLFSLSAAAPKVDWTRRVTITPAGAYVMGNPAAKVRLIEYLSMTCPHCAHYAAESKLPLRRDFVARGTTSVELRHAVRDRLDFVATLAARCGGPARFFGNVEAILAGQQGWIDKGAAFEQANAARLEKLPIADAVRQEARGAGIDAIMAARGVPAAMLDKCLADPAQQKLVGAMTDAAWNDAHIPGTPAFVVNGNMVTNAASWATLEPALKP